MNVNTSHYQWKAGLYWTALQWHAIRRKALNDVRIFAMCTSRTWRLPKWVKTDSMRENSARPSGSIPDVTAGGPSVFSLLAAGSPGAGSCTHHDSLVDIDSESGGAVLHTADRC